MAGARGPIVQQAGAAGHEGRVHGRQDGVIRGGVLAGLAVALVTVAVPVSAAPAGRARGGPGLLEDSACSGPHSGRGAADRGLVCLGQLCTAVGFYGNVPGTGTLAEYWDGTSWSLQATPDPAGAGVSVLKGVSCPAAGFCAAVGRYQNAAGKHVTLAETWNGTAWSIQPAPSPAGARRSYLWAVSCASPTACTATGSYETASRRHVTLAEAWNGTSWSDPAHAPPHAGPQQPVRRVLPVAWCLHRGGHPDR